MIHPALTGTWLVGLATAIAFAFLATHVHCVSPAEANTLFESIEIDHALPNYFTKRSPLLEHSREAFEWRQRKYARSVSVFQHVHKSGGMMVRKFLEAISPYVEDDFNLKDRRLKQADRRKIVAGFTAPSRVRMIRRLHTGIKPPPRTRQIIHGDHAFHYCDYLDLSNPDIGSCAYWIILRDPVERMISDYNYCVNRPIAWSQRLTQFREGRGDHLCTTTGVVHFNDETHKPSLAEWVSTYFSCAAETFAVCDQFACVRSYRVGCGSWQSCVSATDPVRRCRASFRKVHYCESTTSSLLYFHKAC